MLAPCLFWVLCPRYRLLVFCGAPWQASASAKRWWTALPSGVAGVLTAHLGTRKGASHSAFTKDSSVFNLATGSHPAMRAARAVGGAAGSGGLLDVALQLMDFNPGTRLQLEHSMDSGAFSMLRRSEEVDTSRYRVVIDVEATPSSTP